MHTALKTFSFIVFSLALPVQAFKLITVNGKPTRWKERVVTYTFNSTGSDNFTRGCDGAGPCISEKTAVRNAYKAWENVNGANITFKETKEKLYNETGYDNENTIIWIERGWRNQSFTPPSGALAVTISTYNTSDGRMRDSDIHFNGEDFEWGVINDVSEESSGVVDVQNIATHEIGHFFGLDHSSEDIYEPSNELYMATMFFASGPGETFRRVLKEDDMLAVRYLYPSQDVDHPLVDNVTPSAWDARSNPMATLEIQGEGFGPTTNVVLSVGEGNNDIQGNILSNSGSTLQVSFDLYKVASAKYTLIVSNSPDTQEKVDDALDITSYGSSSYSDEGEFGSQSSNASDVGCATSSTNQKGQAFLLLSLSLIFFYSRQRKLS